MGGVGCRATPNPDPEPGTHSWHRARRPFRNDDCNPTMIWFQAVFGAMEAEGRIRGEFTLVLAPIGDEVGLTRIGTLLVGESPPPAEAMHTLTNKPRANTERLTGPTGSNGHGDECNSRQVRYGIDPRSTQRGAQRESGRSSRARERERERLARPPSGIHPTHSPPSGISPTAVRHGQAPVHLQPRTTGGLQAASPTQTAHARPSRLVRATARPRSLPPVTTLDSSASRRPSALL